MNTQPEKMKPNNSPWTDVYQAPKQTATTSQSQPATKTPAQKEAEEASTRAAQEALNNAFNLPH